MTHPRELWSELQRNRWGSERRAAGPDYRVESGTKASAASAAAELPRRRRSRRAEERQGFGRPGWARGRGRIAARAGGMREGVRRGPAAECPPERGERAAEEEALDWD